MTTPAPSSLLTIPDVAKRLKVAEITVRRWIKDREIVAYRLGRQWRISEADLEVYLRMRRGLNLMDSNDN